MEHLSNLTKLTKKRKRIGRSGGRGGTSGKGSKGQKARSGPTLGILFEGGQSPLTRRLPKRGFNNFNFQDVYEIVNLEKLNNLYDAGDQVTKANLVEKGAIKGNPKSLIKILGSGAIDKKLVVHADAFSKSAQAAIEKIGGEVRLIKKG